MANDKNSRRTTAAEEPEASGFPMSLREFAATIKLDPLWEAALSVTCSPIDRTLAAWREALEAVKTQPVRNC